jgi:hypothetical protein
MKRFFAGGAFNSPGLYFCLLIVIVKELGWDESLHRNYLN